MTNRSIVRFIVRFITLFTSFSLTISSQPSTEVKSLIHSLQNKYCGRQFCSSDPSQQPPLCTEKVVHVITDPVTNDTLHMVASTDRQRIPTCSKCSCKESCRLYGDCCADKYSGREYYFDCLEILHYVLQGVENMYSYVVTKCLPDAPNYSKELAEKCEHGELGYIPDGRLVTALHPQYKTNITFRNKYCVMCYNVTNYTPWDVYISCDEDLDWTPHTDINSFLRSFSNSSVCKITTDHLGRATPNICHRYFGMISSCNVTGQWTEYNDTLETACHYYLNPALTYRNIFCALCNGVPHEDVMCQKFDYALRGTWTLFMSFSAKVNFDKSDVEVIKGGWSYPVRRIGKQEKRQCREGDVFDAISEKCREVYCPLSMHGENTPCVKVVPVKTFIVTTWILTAYYTDDVIVPFGELSSELGSSVIDALEERLADMGFIVHRSEPFDFAIIHSIHSLVVKESQLKLELFLRRASGLDSSRQRLMEMTNLTLNVTWREQTVGVYAVPHSNRTNITNMLRLYTSHSVNVPFGFHDIDLSKTINVPLVFNVSCPMLRFESHEVLSVNGSVIIHGSTVLKEDEYFVKDKDYFICFHAAFQPKKSGKDIREMTQTASLAAQALPLEVRLFALMPLVALHCLRMGSGY